MKTMKTGLLAAVIAVAATIFAGIVAAEEVGTKSKDGIGNYLTDSRGMTLYNFDKDSQGKSACAGPCVENWPIFYAEKVTVSKGLDSKNFGTITRDDGKKQTTYKDAPLYYFSKDKAPGDTNGQGFKDIWRAAKP